ncbi:MAG: sigma-70 family RNA polymerase sigma factor [Myxococcota bacterium]
MTEALLPTVHFRVARQLLRRQGRAGGRDVRQEVEDMVQDVFFELFRDDGKRLRSWDPARGLSLENFVGMIAEQRVIATLRSDRRSPWTEDPSEDSVLEGGSASGPRRATGPSERVVSARERIDQILDALRGSVSEQGYRIFEMLFVEQCETDEVCAELGLQPGAVYTWRSRLRKRVAEIAEELDRADAETRVSEERGA